MVYAFAGLEQKNPQAIHRQVGYATYVIIRTNGTRRGFKLVEPFVIIGIVALAISVILPTINRMRQETGRQRCPSNLRQIGQAMQLYMMENKGQFPRTSYKPDAPPIWGTGASSGNPFIGAGRPADNDVTAAMFLLVRTQDIVSETFVCPSTDVSKDLYGGGANTALNRSNFSDWRKNLSYSLAVPYVNFDDELRAKRFKGTGDAAFALAADLNPGVGDGFDVTAVNESSKSADMQKANTRNHEGAGQNVLFADGHVEFVQNPFCGVKRDNIYTVSGATDGSLTTSKTVVGLPAWDGDSVLLPASH
jgi:prepilin-type processing-associated H-X9-DG protein